MAAETRIPAPRAQSGTAARRPGPLSSKKGIGAAPPVAEEEAVKVPTGAAAGGRSKLTVRSNERLQGEVGKNSQPAQIGE